LVISKVHKISRQVILLDSSGKNPVLAEKIDKDEKRCYRRNKRLENQKVLRREHVIIIKPEKKMKTTNAKNKVKVKIHRTSDYDDKYTGIRDFSDEKAMLHYGLSKVYKIIIRKYTQDDEFMTGAQKTRGLKFDYDMELCD